MNDSPLETVQTVQEPATEKKAPKGFYEIAKGADGAYHWCLWSGNGKIVARNARPYASRQQALAAVKKAQTTMKEAEIIAAS